MTRASEQIQYEATMQEAIMLSHLPNPRTSRLRAVCAAAALSLAALLTGCGVGTLAAPVGPATVAGTQINGTIHGGQNPVKQASVQLYAVGTSGYGSASSPLGTAATTDNNGHFSIASGYTCPSGGLVYVVATGGDAGSGTNANLKMMSTLGVCPVSSDTVSINELTTVASVWALSPFMAGPTNIGSLSTPQALAGIAAAFADVNTLVSVPLGTSPGTAAPTNATVPTAAIYTIANILAACINTSGTAGSNTSCSTLFTKTKVGSTTPTDTLTAAMNIAQHPATNVGPLYLLGAALAPYQTALSMQPSDFTLAVTFTGNMSAPSALAADSAGNIWIANKTGNTITELSQNGTLISGTGYVNRLNAPSAVAFDPNGNLWVTNSGNNTLSVLYGTAPLAMNLSPFSGGSMSSPNGIAFDSLGHGWVSNNVAAGTLTEFVPAIDLTPTFSTYTPAGGAHYAVAVNPH